MNAHNCSNKHFEWAQWKWKSTICHIFDQYIKNTPLLDRIDTREIYRDRVKKISFFCHAPRCLPFLGTFPLSPYPPPHPPSQEKVSESSPATQSQSPVWTERPRLQRKSVWKLLGNLQLACTCTCTSPRVILTSPNIVLRSRIGYSSSIIIIEEE